MSLLLLAVLLVLGVALALPLAWVAMLALGILHSYFVAVPPMGFWETFVVVLAFRLLLFPTKASSE
jgi:hypothetical protein